MYKSPCQGAIGQDEEIFTGLGQNPTPPPTPPPPPLLTPFKFTGNYKLNLTIQKDDIL